MANRNDNERDMNMRDDDPVESDKATHLRDTGLENDDTNRADTDFDMTDVEER